MKRLGFDVDGVLYDWHEIVWEYCKQELHMKEDYAEFWTNIVNDFYPKTFTDNLVSISPLYYKRRMAKSVHDMLWDFSNSGYELFYITCRPEGAKLTTERWFRDAEVPNMENLFIINGSKLPLIIENEIDYYVEDRVHIIQEIRHYTQVVLVKKLWNEIIWDEVPTINDVIELPEMIKEIETYGIKQLSG